MSTIDKLLSALRDEGVRVWLESGELRYSAPKGALPPRRLGELREMKQQLVLYLEQWAPNSAATGRLTVGRRPPALPLSFAQERLWLLAELQATGSAFTIACAVRLEGALDVGVLERSLAEIERRHEALRTRFAAVNGEPMQVIDPPGRLRLVVE